MGIGTVNPLSLKVGCKNPPINRYRHSAIPYMVRLDTGINGGLKKSMDAAVSGHGEGEGNL